VTLPAVDSWLVKGIKGGPEYKVGPRCSNPKCGKIAEHAHHIVRRSQLGGDFKWIELEKRIVGNLTGVCVGCHDDLTGSLGGHKAAIRYHHGLFWWSLLGETENGHVDYLLIDPIDPQPPTPETLEAKQSAVSPTEPDCPFCGQKRRRSLTTRGWGRRRKTWTVKVPADEQENGADVLDTLVENLSLVIPNADSSAVGRYYVLVPVLAYATMNVDNFVTSMEGVGA
jgi:hypothetical protein